MSATIGQVSLILTPETRTALILALQAPFLPTTTIVGTASQCDVSPIDFTRSGILYLRGNTLNELGMNNFTWLSTASTSKDIAFMSHYNETLFYPNNTFGRIDGFILRCLTNP